MADAAVANPQASPKPLNLPAETQAKFGELIAMIQQSPSMNQEERQYWVDVLPIMTEAQVQNLRDILNNEKKQLAAAQEQFGGAAKKLRADFDSFEYKEKKRLLKEAEKSAEEAEKKEEEEALNRIQSL